MRGNIVRIPLAGTCSSLTPQRTKWSLRDHRTSFHHRPVELERGLVPGAIVALIVWVALMAFSRLVVFRAIKNQRMGVRAGALVCGLCFGLLPVIIAWSGAVTVGAWFTLLMTLLLVAFGVRLYLQVLSRTNAPRDRQ